MLINVLISCRYNKHYLRWKPSLGKVLGKNPIRFGKRDSHKRMKGKCRGGRDNLAEVNCKTARQPLLCDAD